MKKKTNRSWSRRPPKGAENLTQPKREDFSSGRDYEVARQRYQDEIDRLGAVEILDDPSSTRTARDKAKRLLAKLGPALPKEGPPGRLPLELRKPPAVEQVAERTMPKPVEAPPEPIRFCPTHELPLTMCCEPPVRPSVDDVVCDKCLLPRRECEHGKNRRRVMFSRGQIQQVLSQMSR